MIEIRATVKKTYKSAPRFSSGILRLAKGTSTDPTHCRPVGPLREEKFQAFGPLAEGDVVVLRGEWVDHPTYGHQFKVQSYEHDRPEDEAGLANFLADHPALRNIGDVRARRIVAEIGAADFSRTLLENPGRIADLAGVSVPTVEKIRELWLRGRAENEDRIKLAAYNLTTSQQNRLYEVYKNSDAVIVVLRDRPYEIIERVPGFGFATVDAIARRLGRERSDPGRVAAGVWARVEVQLSRGHCWTHRADLVEEAVEFLKMGVADDRERTMAAVDALIADGRLATVEDRVGSAEILKQERDIAEVLAERASRPNQHLGDVADLVPEELNEAQRRAVLAAAEESALLVTGGAGVGKTHTVRAIVRLYEEHRKRVALVAPTGKAAKRLSEVVGRPASTIHRFLGFERKSSSNFDIESLFLTDGERAKLSPESADAVIVDETSMVDVDLMWRLLKRLGRKTAIVFVGDHNQLPSVGPGSVLRDLVWRQPIRAVVLDEVVRQAGPLKECSIAVLAGEVRETVGREQVADIPWMVVDAPEDPDAALDILKTFWTDVLPNDFGLDVLRDVQLLVPTNKGPLGTRALNEKLQVLVQASFGVEVQPAAVVEEDAEEDEDARGDGAVLYPGDRVIHVKNNYYLGVMNGEVGTVREVNRENGNVSVAYDDDDEVVYDPSTRKRELRLAYALTVHKYQGSQVRCALVFASQSRIMTKNLLYTAVTRAQKTAILIGPQAVLEEAAKREDAVQRRTFLSVIDVPRRENG